MTTRRRVWPATIASVAEGVETVEEERTLRNLGVDKGQGYVFSKPKPAGELVRAARAG